MIKSQIAMEKYIDIFNKLWKHSENEVVEFKKAETNFDIDELGKYFSALSNEANLREYPDFVNAPPRKNKSSNIPQRECNIWTSSRIGVRIRHFTLIFPRHPE